MVLIEKVIPELIQDIHGVNRFGVYVVIRKGLFFPKYFGKTYIVYVDSSMSHEKMDSKYCIYANDKYSGKEFLVFSDSEAIRIDTAIIEECKETIECVIKNLYGDRPLKPGNKKIDHYLRNIKDNIDIVTLSMDEDVPNQKAAIYAVLKIADQVVCNVRNYLRTGDFSSHKHVIIETDAILNTN